jgi:hypothetical protein
MLVAVCAAGPVPSEGAAGALPSLANNTLCVAPAPREYPTLKEVGVTLPTPVMLPLAEGLTPITFTVHVAVFDP